MNRSRSLLGRVSFLWAAGFFILAAVEWIGARAAPGWTAEAVLTDSYLLVQRAQGAAGVGVGAAALAFALAYLALEALRRGPHRVALGRAHLVLTYAGVSLALLPARALALAQGPGRLGGREGLERLNALAAAGDAAVWVGQLFFVAVLIDAFRREADPR